MTEKISRSRLDSAAALFVALGLVACGSGDSAVGGGSAAATDRTADGQWNASLAPVGESGVQGTVRITPGGDSLTVKLELLGVAEGERYPARLVAAGCSAEGETVAELDAPHVGTVGVGSSLSRIGPDVLGGDATTYSVRVLSPGGATAACGELRRGGV